MTSESTTLDQFFAEKNELPTILKIDVDGGEKDLLSGASRVLQQSDELKISLCTYHQKDDFREFKTLLEKVDFKVHSSKGYMIFYLDEPLEEPYLRKALLFASKYLILNAVRFHLLGICLWTQQLFLSLYRVLRQHLP